MPTPSLVLRAPASSDSASASSTEAGTQARADRTAAATRCARSDALKCSYNAVVVACTLGLVSSVGCGGAQPPLQRDMPAYASASSVAECRDGGNRTTPSQECAARPDTCTSAVAELCRYEPRWIRLCEKMLQEDRLTCRQACLVAQRQELRRRAVIECVSLSKRTRQVPRCLASREELGAEFDCRAECRKELERQGRTYPEAP